MAITPVSNRDLLNDVLARETPRVITFDDWHSMCRQLWDTAFQAGYDLGYMMAHLPQPDDVTAEPQD